MRLTPIVLTAALALTVALTGAARAQTPPPSSAAPPSAAPPSAAPLATAPPPAAGPASAPPLTAPAWTVGGKLMSCQAWTADRPQLGQVETLKRIAPMSWVLGYLSGQAAAMKRDLLGGLGPSVIAQWLDNYCLAHPTDDIPRASAVLAADLARGPGR